MTDCSTVEHQPRRKLYNITRCTLKADIYKGSYFDRLC